MNIALEDTQEVVEGVHRAKYGDSFIRGNNGESFLPHSLSVCKADAADPLAVLYITAKE
jgi:hypothetical protein